jgi:hypothetical protein|nr:MAG TPA: Polysaccharide Lyase Family 6 enzyme, LYASE [Caudoviricetes sp.]
MATVISEKLTINGVGSEVVLDGFDFTGNGYVEVKNASAVTIKNCRIYGIVPEAAKSFWLHVYNDIPVKLVVENCFFGNNPASGSNKMYNLIEPTAQFMDGSSISNNYFAADCCTHNIINVYGAVDNSEININGNVVEMTAGGVRIGVKGDKTCSINVRNNKVLAENPAYTAEDQGLVTIQPYNKSTTSFAKMTIAMSGNELPCDQIIYAGYTSKDTVLNSETMPKVIINGKVANVTIYQW